MTKSRSLKRTKKMEHSTDVIRIQCITLRKFMMYFIIVQLVQQ